MKGNCSVEWLSKVINFKLWWLHLCILESQWPILNKIDLPVIKWNAIHSQARVFKHSLHAGLKFNHKVTNTVVTNQLPRNSLELAV